jgi:hypothetical protein
MDNPNSLPNNPARQYSSTVTPLFQQRRLNVPIMASFVTEQLISFLFMGMQQIEADGGEILVWVQRCVCYSGGTVNFNLCTQQPNT